MQTDYDIPGGMAGTQFTVEVIESMKKKVAARRPFRVFVLNLLDQYGIDPLDKRQVAELFLKWVHKNIRYVPDPLHTEFVQCPLELLKVRYGDCDDMALLLASMLEAVGIDTRFVTTGHSAANMEHIYIEIEIGGKWFPADPTLDMPLGVAVELGSKKIFNNLGYIMPIDNEKLHAVVYDATLEKLHHNMQSGRIVPSDIYDYIGIIESGNSPFQNEVVNQAMLSAFYDYLPLHYDTGEVRSGLRGFFGDIFSAVKSVVNEVFSGLKIDVGATVHPAGDSTVQSSIVNYLPIVFAAGLAIILITRK
jgi:hypothetical protein